MSFRDYLSNKLYETPIAYDDETDNLADVGAFHSETNTKWAKTPPVNATLEEVAEWVKQKEQNKEIEYMDLGKGISKMAKMNDGKTVFKWNFDVTEHGDQIAREVEVYKKYYNKFKNVLPKFYKIGKNWLIQEFVEPASVSNNYEISKFKQITGVEFFEFYGDYGLIKSLVFVKKDFYMEYGNGTFEEFIKYFTRNGDTRSSYKKLLGNENIRELLRFSYETGISMGDFHGGNIGITKDNKIKVIDFGV